MDSLVGEDGCRAVWALILTTSRSHRSCLRRGLSRQLLGSVLDQEPSSFLARTEKTRECIIS